MPIRGILDTNQVLNGRLSREGGFSRAYIPPCPGDEGVAIGCALFGLHLIRKERGLNPPARAPRVAPVADVLPADDENEEEDEGDDLEEIGMWPYSGTPYSIFEVVEAIEEFEPWLEIMDPSEELLDILTARSSEDMNATAGPSDAAETQTLFESFDFQSDPEIAALALEAAAESELESARLAHPDDDDVPLDNDDEEKVGVGGRIEPSEWSAVLAATAAALDSGKVVAWFQGRSEYGPRALGKRSLMIDPRNATLKEKLNDVIKVS